MSGMSPSPGDFGFWDRHVKKVFAMRRFLRFEVSEVVGTWGRLVTLNLNELSSFPHRVTQAGRTSRVENKQTTIR